MNISSVHVPSFCKLSRQGRLDAYLNAYDLKRLGMGAGASQTRQRVDAALPLPANITPERVYFGAVEVAGTGIRFYGDFCFVLKPAVVLDNTVILETNSYDLAREPLATVIHRAQTPESKRRFFASRMSATWGNDRCDVIASKVLQTLGEREYRLTLGQIAHAARNDEHYVEVLHVGSFSADQLEEVRVSAEDAALEAQIAARLQVGPAPSAAEAEWRQRRRQAVAALNDLRVPVRTITTIGRTKGE